MSINPHNDGRGSEEKRVLQEKEGYQLFDFCFGLFYNFAPSKFNDLKYEFSKLEKTRFKLSKLNLNMHILNKM